MTSHQITEWMAYERIDPWDESRADMRAGIVASTVANVHRGKGKPAHKPEDFMPRFSPGREEQSIQEQLAAFREFAAAHNAAHRK